MYIFDTYIDGAYTYIAAELARLQNYHIFFWRIEFRSAQVGLFLHTAGHADVYHIWFWFSFRGSRR